MSEWRGSETGGWLPERVFIIAEAGVNHDGDLGRAKEMIDAAVEAGADAVKFQTFRPDQLVTGHAEKAEYQKRSTDPDESQYQMLCRLTLSAQDHLELKAHCAVRQILFLSTPFEEESADFLEEVGVPMFKLPSGEITNLPFLAHVARKGKPVILSTGMSTLGEVEAAVHTMLKTGNARLALLHCVSNYPADPRDVNLRAMQTLSTAFGLPSGYSDHTMGLEVALAAVALGARILEKHFTLDRSLPGADQAASAEPAELRALVRAVRLVESCLGNGRKQPAASEAGTAAAARKSIVAVRDLAAGTVIEPAMVALKRPGTGLPPSMLGAVEGRRLRRGLKAGDLITLEALE